MRNRAGKTPASSALVDIDRLLADYFELKPDVSLPEQKVSFGTSGHRGSSSSTSFKKQRILAITQAIVDYRKNRASAGQSISASILMLCLSLPNSQPWRSWQETIFLPSLIPAMASLIAVKDKFDISTGNDADADRHGIVTRDHGLMNPNHFLAVAIQYLFANRPSWSKDAAVSKTMVSSRMIDRVVESLGKKLVEVPVGIKWFVPGLIDGSVGFGGKKSAGASFLRLDGTAWSTDKDGLIMCLLAAEIQAVTGKSPSEHYLDLTDKFGEGFYERIDAAATPVQKSLLGKLSAKSVTATELAGEKIGAVLTHAPGNGAALGGLKVETKNSWFAARPSGTEDVYKIYAESCISQEHLKVVQQEANALVDSVFS